MVKKKIRGRLSLHYDGYGFVEPEGQKGNDVFIPARYVGSAMHGDGVEISVLPPDSEGRLEGRVEGVFSRGMTQVVGRVERAGKFWQVVADDRRVRHAFTVPNSKLNHARPLDTVVVRITHYPDDPKGPAGEVIRVLPARGHLSAEVEIVIAKHQLDLEFPDAVLSEARERADDWQARELLPRRDLRAVPLVTIDGESAKDFDDAVAVEKLADGFRLTIAIADVSHFVQIGSPIDQEARRRGTSVYFPDRCLPMLPPILSEDVCSLRPHEDRFTMSCIIDFGPDGGVRCTEFDKSVIRSRARLTYTLVGEMLKKESDHSKTYPTGLLDHVRLMGELAAVLRRRRMERGSIDFDLPEPEIILNLEEGNIEKIVMAERNEAHLLIEEFMIAANEAVARFLTDAKAGCIYRVHDQPDPIKIRQFAETLKELGYPTSFTYPLKPKALAQTLQKIKGHAEERMLNHLLLRSMAQAQYSATNIGHFGLASTCYCHFTSPIRRYPDLVIHRLLTGRLKSYNAKLFHETERQHHRRARQSQGASGGQGDSLEAVAAFSSQRERVAMEAEREMESVFKIFFMRDKVGKTFDGIVSHVAKFGFFVELTDFFVEGVIRMADLPDFYKYDSRRHAWKKGGLEYRVGTQVRVLVQEVNIERREILFTILTG